VVCDGFAGTRHTRHSRRLKTGEPVTTTALPQILGVRPAVNHAGVRVRGLGTGRYRIHPAGRDGSPERRGVCSVALFGYPSLGGTPPGAAIPGTAVGKIILVMEWYSVDVDDDARTIGRRLRRIRKVRHKSLIVVAELAGISTATLSRIENGLRALDRHSEIVALAAALEISPSELMKVPVPAWGNGYTDSTTEAVRHALMAASDGLPGGQVLGVDALRDRIAALIEAHGRCDPPGDIGAVLPAVIRDLHTSISAGRDVAELLKLAILLHTQVTVGWLRVVGASLDLRWEAAVLARNAAQELDTPTALGVALWGRLYVLIGTGNFGLALAGLDALTVPTSTPESMQVAGTLALSRSLLAAVDSRPGDVEAPFQEAVELAARTGEGNAYGMGFGPTNVGLWRMYGQLDVYDYEQAVHVGEGLHPEAHCPPLVQADHWVNYGRALARVRGRRDDAVMAFLRAEEISPHRLYRDPFATDVIAELLARFRRDAVARDLRRMAYRAGLPA
jgi:Helix-turn-helix domain